MAQNIYLVDGLVSVWCVGKFFRQQMSLNVSCLGTHQMEWICPGNCAINPIKATVVATTCTLSDVFILRYCWNRSHLLHAVCNGHQQISVINLQVSDSKAESTWLQAVYHYVHESLHFTSLCLVSISVCFIWCHSIPYLQFHSSNKYYISYRNPFI